MMPLDDSAARPRERDHFCVLDAVRAVAGAAAANAGTLDRDGAFPVDEVAALARHGLLTAPFPHASGGTGLGTEPAAAHLTLDVLRIIGRASQPLGRLFEGHINAVKLACRYGSPQQQRALFGQIAREGLLLGVWNTESPPGLRLETGTRGKNRLSGGKIYASGAGFLRRAIVTARSRENAPSQMVLFELTAEDACARSDLSSWQGVHGMRASATGSIDLSGLDVADDQLVGAPGDYLRQPEFSAGAWRFAAVQLGGAEALLGALRDHLRATGREEDAIQRARFGDALMAIEGARLWLRESALRAEDPDDDPEAAVAHVNLARLAVERACLDVLEHVHRGIGMKAFQGGHPVERMSRDLQLYLRQPAPDAARDATARWALAHEHEPGLLWR